VTESEADSIGDVKIGGEKAGRVKEKWAEQQYEGDWLAGRLASIVGQKSATI